MAISNIAIVISVQYSDHIDFNLGNYQRGTGVNNLLTRSIPQTLNMIFSLPVRYLTQTNSNIFSNIYFFTELFFF